MTTQIDSRINCRECTKRLSEIAERIGHLGISAGGKLFDVGNGARPEMGHAMAFTHDGRIALCIARRLVSSS